MTSNNRYHRRVRRRKTAGDSGDTSGCGGKWLLSFPDCVSRIRPVIELDDAKAEWLLAGVGSGKNRVLAYMPAKKGKT